MILFFILSHAVFDDMLRVALRADHKTLLIVIFETTYQASIILINAGLPQPEGLLSYFVIAFSKEVIITQAVRHGHSSYCVQRIRDTLKIHLNNTGG
jgi:hypothetical protein